MNTIPLVVSLLLFAPIALAVDPSDAPAIEKALNQGVELDHPDVQAVTALRILAGGQTRNGDFLYVCEGDLVWTVSIAEFKEMVQQAAKRQGETGEFFAALAPWAIDLQVAHFKKGDLVAKVRIRVRLEKAGDDLIAMSAKVKKFDADIKLNE